MKPDNFHPRLLSPILLICVFSCLLSCNNESKQTQSFTDSSGNVADSSGNDTMQGKQPAIVKFYDLVLDIPDLKKILNTGTSSEESQTVKILFQFIDGDLTSFQPLNLIAYGAKQNNDTTSGPIELAKQTATWELTGAGVIGNLELSRKKLRAILGLTGGGPIQDSEFKKLYFFPYKNPSNNHISYLISTSSTRPAPIIKQGTTTGDNELNPSPPDPPCETDCIN